MPFRELNLDLNQKSNIGVGVDLTQICQARCITCFFEPESIPQDTMPPAMFRRIVDQAVACDFSELYLLGGEPTLHPELLKLLDYAISYRAAGEKTFNPIILVTNGIRLADADYCREISSRGVMIAVQRHVIGDCEEESNIQDTLMGIKGTLPKVNSAFKNIEKFFEPDKVAVQCCITRPVVETGQIYKVFEYARQHGFEHVMECTKAGPAFARGNPQDISPQQLLEVYELFQGFDRQRYPEQAARLLTPQAYGKVCHMPETGVHVLINGDVIPCVGQRYVLGNITKDSLGDILTSPQRKFFQQPEQRIEGHCRDCDYLPECTGGCRGDAFYLTGCFNASAIQCPQVAKYPGKLDTGDFLPGTCAGCKMADDTACSIRDIRPMLQLYLGTKFGG